MLDPVKYHLIPVCASGNEFPVREHAVEIESVLPEDNLFFKLGNLALYQFKNGRWVEFGVTVGTIIYDITAQVMRVYGKDGWKNMPLLDIHDGKPVEVGKTTPPLKDSGDEAEQKSGVELKIKVKKRKTIEQEQIVKS